MVFKKALAALVFTLPLVLGLTINRRAAVVPAKCAFLLPIADDLLDNLFTNECGDAAHGALRLVFHDAIGIDPVAGGGGADGSIITFNETELAFPANDGLDDVLDNVGPFFLKYKDVLSPGDFVQFAGALSLAACPGAPQVKFSLGRPQPNAVSPPNLVPEPFDNVDVILARMNAAGGFSPQEVIALLASHSIAGADTVDPSIPGTPFDSTPSVFDTQIFIDVQLRGTLFPGATDHQGEVMSAIAGTIRLQSDHNFARDSATSCFWQALATDQAGMQSQFGAALFKLSLLGQNVNELTDCSAVIPQPPAFTGTATFPPSLTHSDIEQACATAAFPNLPTPPGPPLVVPAIPQADSSAGGDS
jgi:cytochrome c peroxidase